MPPSERDLEYGRIAVKNNFLTQEQFDDCLRMKESLKEKYGKEYDLEQILFEKGLVSDTQSEVIKKVLQRKLAGGPASTKIRRPRTASVRRSGTHLSRRRPTAGPMAARTPDPDAPLVEEEIDVDVPSGDGDTVRCQYCATDNQLGQSKCRKCKRVLPQPGGSVARRAIVSRQTKEQAAAVAGGGGRGSGKWIALAGGLALVAGVGLVLALRRGPSDEGPDEPDPPTATVEQRDLDDLTDQMRRGVEAEQAGDYRLAWDRYRAAERKADGLLRSVGAADARRRDLKRLFEESVLYRRRVIDERIRTLDEAARQARRYIDEGDWREARSRGREVETEAARWKDLLDREGLGSGPFGPLEDKARRILDDAERLSQAEGSGSVQPLLGEFDMLARNLLSIDRRDTWVKRAGDVARFLELGAELRHLLAADDERLAEIDRQVAAMRQLEQELMGRDDPGHGADEWLPEGGPWTDVFGGGGPTRDELEEALVHLLDPAGARALDPDYFEVSLAESAGVLVDRKGRIHRGRIEEREATFLVIGDGKRYEVAREDVERRADGTTYWASDLPETAHDRKGQPIGGRPVRVVDRSVVFEGPGAPSVGVALGELDPIDAYAILQNLDLEPSDGGSHLRLARLLVELGLAWAAREEYLEAVRLEPALLVAGLPTFRPVVFYRALHQMAGRDAAVRFRIALWARLALGDEAFLEQLEFARRLDPETYAGPWMNLAVGLWLSDKERLPQAIAETQAVLDDGQAPLEARRKAERLMILLESQRPQWEEEQRRQRVGRIAGAVLVAVRELISARAAAGHAWSEDEAWVRGPLLADAQARVARVAGLEAAEIEATWTRRGSEPESLWPVRTFALDEGVWIVDTPAILDLAHGAEQVGAWRAGAYGALSAEVRAQILLFLFARHRLETVGGAGRDACQRCRGHDRIADLEDYMSRFGGQFGSLCDRCRGLGYRLVLRAR